MKSLKLLAIFFLLYLFKIFINVCVIVNKFDTWYVIQIFYRILSMNMAGESYRYKT